MELTQAALDYLAEGFNPLPLKENKAPMLPVGHNFLYEPVPESEVAKLFAKAIKIGIACGDISGQFECLDFDGKGGKPIGEIFEAFTANESAAEIIRKHDLPIVQTPSGGYHIYYRHTDPRQGSRKLARWEDSETMIETRGHGSYVATVPSPGYSQISGTDILEISRLESYERDTLIAIAESLSKAPIKTKSKPSTTGAWPDKFDVTTAWGRYNEEEVDEMKQILIENGWTYINERQYDKVEYWQRPGKDERLPVTGATFGKQHHMFYVFTDNAVGFEPYTAYTPLDIFIHYRHNGDKEAAIRELEKRYDIKHYKDTPSEAPQTPSSAPGHVYTDPVSWFNWNKQDFARQLLVKANWSRPETSTADTEQWSIQEEDSKKNKITHKAIWDKHSGLFTTASTTVKPLRPDTNYTPFQLLVILKFKGNHRGAYEWIITNYLSEDMPYMRIGPAYFKRIIKTDRYGIDRTEYKPWLKDEIKLDLGAEALKNIPHYDDFTIRPDNFNYQPVIGNNYNLYAPFPHQPQQGEWPWSKLLMEHIFGDQYDLGMRYMHMLYLHPDHILPILVLVSRERQTGKTTFIDWMNIIFGANVANVSPEDLSNSFNSAYACSNIVAIEETFVEKAVTVEKLKALSTAKEITVNRKMIAQYSVPFYGKIILASNHEDRFARIDQEEIRFFVRKVGTPQNANHNILSDLRKEVPAFLHHLTTLPPVDMNRDRSGFTPDELNNDFLQAVKEESRTGMHKMLYDAIEKFFLNEGADLDEFCADSENLKKKFFEFDHKVDTLYIKRTCRVDMKLKSSDATKRYVPFGLPGAPTEVGKPYTFYRKDFVTDDSAGPPGVDTIPF